jgi:hypothetical protein
MNLKSKLSIFTLWSKVANHSLPLNLLGDFSAPDVKAGFVEKSLGLEEFFKEMT